MKINPGFQMREFNGEFIIVTEGEANFDYSQLISFNATTAFLWNAVSDREFSLDDMVQALTGEYEVAEDVARADCKRIAEQWKAAGLVSE